MLHSFHMNSSLAWTLSQQGPPQLSSCTSMCMLLCVSTPSLGAFMCASVAGPGTAQFNCWEGQGNRAGRTGHGSSRGQGSNTGQCCSAAGQGSAGHRCSAVPPRSPQPSPISQDSPASALQPILFNQDHPLVKISSHNVSTKLVCMLIGVAHCNHFIS